MQAPKIFENCPKNIRNISDHFRKFSKIAEDFWGRYEDVSIICQRLYLLKHFSLPRIGRLGELIIVTNSSLRYSKSLSKINTDKTAYGTPLRLWSGRLKEIKRSIKLRKSPVCKSHRWSWLLTGARNSFSLLRVYVPFETRISHRRQSCLLCESLVSPRYTLRPNKLCKSP